MNSNSLFLTIVSIILSVFCYGQRVDSLQSLPKDITSEKCFENGYYNSTYKEYTIQRNTCEENAAYLFDTITKKRIKIDVMRWTGHTRFEHGFVFVGGDMKGLMTVDGKHLISYAHYIYFNDSDSVISAFICSTGWLFMNYFGDTISFGYNGGRMNYIPSLSTKLNVAEIDTRNKTKAIFRYGYLNKKGYWIIQPIFENAKDFIDGFAKVKLDGKWGTIDENGEFAVSANYDSPELVPAPKKFWK